MEIEDFDDDELIAEIKRRKLEEEFETEVEIESDKDIGDFEDEELLKECRDRGFRIGDSAEFRDLEFTSMFADGIWDNMAEIAAKYGEQKLHGILERFLTAKISRRV